MFGQTAFSFCLLGTIATVAITMAAEASLPTVDSAALGSQRKLPWSEPVQIDDPFEGSFVGVFDRHFFFGRFLNASVRIEVQSLWRPDSVRFVTIIRDRDCIGNQSRVFSSLNCSESNSGLNLIGLFIKLDDDVIQVTGQNSTFPVSPELAQALLTAPKETISIRLVTDSGESIDSEIGQGTVEAWSRVYASQADALDATD